eukprot:6644950-Pyramimonas_sp.AAC.1
MSWSKRYPNSSCIIGHSQQVSHPVGTWDNKVRKLMPDPPIKHKDVPGSKVYVKILVVRVVMVAKLEPASAIFRERGVHGYVNGSCPSVLGDGKPGPNV